MGTVRRNTMLILTVVLVAAVSQIEGSHFRGGTINWKWQEGTKVQFHYRLGWRYGTGPGCTPSLIGQHVGISDDHWTCQSGSCGNSELHDINYVCTAANVAEDWEQGKDDFSHEFHSTGPFTVGFANGNWIELSNGKGTGEWNIATTIDLRSRSDTGTPNSSPESQSKPIYYVQFDCEIRIRLPVVDQDGDTTRCRWAKGGECVTVCNALPFAELEEETCTLKFNTTYANNYIDDGIYAVAVTIEDFPKETISLDGAAKKTPSDALSTVPLQFLVKTLPHASACDAGPMFIPPTPKDGEVLTVAVEETISVDLFADNQKDTSAKANVITVSGPTNMTQSSVTLSRDVPDTYTTTLTWQTTTNDIGSHIVCAHVTNDKGKNGEQRCFVIKVLGKKPEFCKLPFSPCQNGGKWVAYKNNYACICKPGFTGVHCEVDFDDCVELLTSQCPAL